MVAGQAGLRAVLAVGVTCHCADVPTVETVATPLRQIAAQLQHIAVALGFQLPATVFKAGMRPDVTHPHTGDFFLARQHVDVLRLSQTIVQSGHKQRVSGVVVRQITACFRAVLLLGDRRCDRYFRLRDYRIYRVWIYRVWVNRIRVMRIDRVRVFRIRWNRNKAGQIPVAALLHHVIVVRTGNNTARFLKSTVRITGHFDNLNTFNSLCPGSANIIHRHKRVTGGIAEHFQLVGFGGIVIQDGIENQFAAVAGEIFINGKRLPRFAVSMPKVHH